MRHFRPGDAPALGALRLSEALGGAPALPREGGRRFGGRPGGDAADDGGATGPSLVRITLADGRLGRVERVALTGLHEAPGLEIYAPDMRVVFPLASSFYMSAGRRECLCDPNQVAIVPGGASTRDRRHVSPELDCLLITPSRELTDEVESERGTRFARSPLARAGSPRAQRLAALAAARGTAAGADGRLFLEEALVDLLREALGEAEPARVQVAPKSLKRVAAVKDLLASSEAPLSLTQIAAGVGGSPAYLTDLFRRVEGMPIARYQARLRLARALVRLPDTEDITGLALDLGYSSHSHFTAVFRSAFGVSPSAHRAAARS
jgi:AraC-like DNA-binding protein